MNSKPGRGGTRYLPLAFTEQVGAMSASILNGYNAININIQLIRVFIKIRQIILSYTELLSAIEEIRKNSENNSKNIERVFKYLDELLERKENHKPQKAIECKLSKK